MKIEPGSTDAVFTLSPRGARVSISLKGQVSDLESVVVAFLPESGEIPDVESILHPEPDESGKFTVRALDASNWALMMRPDMLLEKYRKLVPLISVAEGEHKQIVIPVVKIQIE